MYSSIEDESLRYLTREVPIEGKSSIFWTGERLIPCLRLKPNPRRFTFRPNNTTEENDEEKTLNMPPPVALSLSVFYSAWINKVTTTLI